MRKFLLPVINLVNVILVSIAWGLSANSAVQNSKTLEGYGNFYEVVWIGSKANVPAIIAFFLFCFASLAMLIAFLPIKSRKFITCCVGVMFIATGVLFLISPFHPFYDRGMLNPELTGSLIAMAVLVFIAGAFSLLMSVIEFLGKKKEAK